MAYREPVDPLQPVSVTFDKERYAQLIKELRTFGQDNLSAGIRRVLEEALLKQLKQRGKQELIKQLSSLAKSSDPTAYTALAALRQQLASQAQPLPAPEWQPRPGGYNPAPCSRVRSRAMLASWHRTLASNFGGPHEGEPHRKGIISYGIERAWVFVRSSVR